MLHGVPFLRKLLVEIQHKLVNDVVFRGDKTVADAVSNFLHRGKDGILYLTETVLLAHFNNVEHSFGNIHQKLIHGHRHPTFLNFAIESVLSLRFYLFLCAQLPACADFMYFKETAVNQHAQEAKIGADIFDVDVEILV